MRWLIGDEFFLDVALHKCQITIAIVVKYCQAYDFYPSKEEIEENVELDYTVLSKTSIAQFQRNTDSM